MANFAPGGFSTGFARGAQAAQAAQQQIQQRLKDAVDRSEKSALAAFNQQVQIIGQAAERGASDQDIQQLADHAMQSLQAHALLLQQLRAQGVAAGGTAEQVSLLPDPDRFIQDHVGVLEGTVANASKNTPAQAGAAAADKKFAEAQQLAESLGVPVERVAEAMNIAKAPQSGPFEGTGFPQQAANAVIGLGNRIKRGETLSDEEHAQYSIAYAQLTAPRVVGSPDQGFSIVEPQLDPRIFPAPDSLGAPSAGAEQAAGPSSPATSQTGEPAGARITPLSQRENPDRAGRTSMMSQAVQSARNIRDSMVRPDGTINRALVSTFVMNFPGTEGRKLRAQFADAAAAKLRLETGAQANETEIQNIVDRFSPSLFDNDATIADKLNRMTAFFEDSLKNTNPELFDALTARSGKKPEPPADEPGAEFQGFDAETGLAVFKRPDGTYFGMRQNAGSE